MLNSRAFQTAHSMQQLTRAWLQLLLRAQCHDFYACLVDSVLPIGSCCSMYACGFVSDCSAQTGRGGNGGNGFAIGDGNSVAIGECAMTMS